MCHSLSGTDEGMANRTHGGTEAVMVTKGSGPRRGRGGSAQLPPRALGVPGGSPQQVPGEQAVEQLEGVARRPGPELLVHLGHERRVITGDRDGPDLSGVLRPPRRAGQAGRVVERVAAVVDGDPEYAVVAAVSGFPGRHH